MRIIEAYEKLSSLAGMEFGSLFTREQLEDIKINKGKTGQLLELALGMPLSSRSLDFEDGELKTNKCDSMGNSTETIFITQISSFLDDMLSLRPFEETPLYEKTKSMLYVPVCKEGEPEAWKFFPCIFIDIRDPRYRSLVDIWRKDYESICRQLLAQIESGKDGEIHTTNGQHLQVRCKDWKDAKGEYHPIYSNRYQRIVADKNHAFYFQKKFVSDIRRFSTGYWF